MPRWEWRCFGPALKSIADAAAMPADLIPRDSAERYILELSGLVSRNIKIRDGLLDVKRLLRTSPDGLELWAPVMKAPFPLERQKVAELFDARAAPGGLTRQSYTAEQLVDDIVIPCRDLRLVDVNKSRRGFAFADCLAEFAELRLGVLNLQSFSLEHEDAERVRAALRSLGLDARGNTNYVRGLTRALGLEAIRDPATRDPAVPATRL